MTEEKGLVQYQPEPRALALALETVEELLSFGKIMAASGMFPDIKSEAQAVVKIVAGRELGLPALYSLRKLYVIKGQLTLSADAMAILIKRSGEYDYTIQELSDARCSILFTRHGKPCGPLSTFSNDDARKAGLLVDGGSWAKFPRNMLFARALSNGARWYCPHLLGGAYTPEELAETGDTDSRVVDLEPVPVTTAPQGDSHRNGNSTVPEDPAQVPEWFSARVAAMPELRWSEETQVARAKALAIALKKRGLSDKDRANLYEILTGRTSGKDMDPRDLVVLQECVDQAERLLAVVRWAEGIAAAGPVPPEFAG